MLDVPVPRRGLPRRTALQDTGPIQHVVERAHRLDRLGRLVAVDRADLSNLDVPLVLDDRHSSLLRPGTLASDVPATRAGSADVGTESIQYPDAHRCVICASGERHGRQSSDACRIAMHGVAIPKPNRPSPIALQGGDSPRPARDIAIEPVPLSAVALLVSPDTGKARLAHLMLPDQASADARPRPRS